MALWGKTDAAGSVPKWFDKYHAMDSLETNAPTVPGRQVLFVSVEEAQLEENIKKGFDTPGWWSYYTIEMPDGTKRYKTECLVVLSETQANAGDGTYARYSGGSSRTDDAEVGDPPSITAISISAPPVAVTGAATPYTGTFGVTAAGQATLEYQWQRQTANGTTWTNITNGGVFSGALTATLTLTAAAKATYDGYKFRVRVSSTGGAATVISNSASITYA
jgi:hypothetical protein